MCSSSCLGRRVACPHCIQTKHLHLDQLGGVRSGVIIVDSWLGTAGAWKGVEEQELALVPGRHRGRCLSAAQFAGPQPHSVRVFILAGEIPASQSSCDTPCEKKT